MDSNDSVSHRSPLDDLYAGLPAVPTKEKIQPLSASGDANSTSCFSGPPVAGDSISLMIKSQIDDALEKPLVMISNLVKLLSKDENTSVDDYADKGREVHGLSDSDEDSTDLLDQLSKPVDTGNNDLDSDLEIQDVDPLAGLCDLVSEEVLSGPALSESLSGFLNGFLARSPTGKAMKAITKDIEAILVPSNCSGLTVPKCNSFVWEVIPHNIVKTNDIKLQNIQTSFIKGLVPIAHLLDSLATTQKEGKKLDNCDSAVEAIKRSLRIFMCSYTALMDYRASCIKLSVSNDVRRIIEGDKKPSASNLFGDDFVEKIKNFNSRASFVDKFSQKSSSKKFSQYKKHKDDKPYRRPRFPKSGQYDRDNNVRKPQFKERNFYNKSNKKY